LFGPRVRGLLAVRRGGRGKNGTTNRLQGSRGRREPIAQTRKLYRSQKVRIRDQLFSEGMTPGVSCTCGWRATKWKGKKGPRTINSGTGGRQGGIAKTRCVGEIQIHYSTKAHGGSFCKARHAESAERKEKKESKSSSETENISREGLARKSGDPTNPKQK